MKDVVEEIKRIKTRNQIVEAEKAWEVSKFRTFLISLLTYLMTSLVFYIIGVENFLLNALIPTLGFIISTQSLRPIKNWWINRRIIK